MARITNHIRSLRENKDLTQEALAAAVAVSRQTIIALERGNYEPSLGLALKLSRFFNLRVEELFMLK